MSILGCADLSVRIADKAILTSVTLSIEAGKVTTIVGPNGAGKSTLLTCLAGLRQPTSGMATLDGLALASMAPRKRARRLAFLPQTPEIAWSVEGRTLIELGRTPFVGARGPTAEDRAAVDRAMAAARVAPFERRIVDTLSGGERARVLIARALAGEPEWLLADEPLTGLDPAHQLDAAALFRQLAESGVGVVLTLHDLSMALRLSDRIIVLADGGVLGDDPPAAALTPDVLRRAYGVEATLTQGPGGPLIDVIGRA
ncbi:ABC transporter ATP-binding protein [Phenylobacterium sp.]|uniref:ABC transporter ATP-binding protein n=1 Tax=Phenylobacterium sp. TaxID=1871053 RepID=UPI0027309D88|nr:ABC transporter ATP-binding protein [Phenylobacterium sp.]MDP1619250.1 ABC transporter ATP-binding protein [Phenylobacterium sp.]MDP1989126.1 ABC transporter ATP-binding protein [Phenylobacterium sp.]